MVNGSNSYLYKKSFPTVAWTLTNPFNMQWTHYYFRQFEKLTN